MKCNLCPNECNIDRNLSIGACNSKNQFKIAKYSPFFYEEPCISGTLGSGAVFFCGCPLKCKFCQNFEVSRNLLGKEIAQTEFLRIVRELEEKKVHNINLVNPTHYLENLEKAFLEYKPNVPVVYNTHGYEKLDMINRANKFVDIYLTDLKFYSPNRSLRYCGKENYFEIASKAILKMVENKPLVFDGDILKSGVIVRHLILPQNTDESIKILDWFKENIGNKAIISVMSQYTPFGDIDWLPELSRPITRREEGKIFSHLFSLNLKYAYVQEKESATTKYIPIWDY